MEDSTKAIANHYDNSADSYHLQYEGGSLSDISKPYPSNYFRMHLLINSFIKHELRKVIEVGVGEGTPLITLAKAGMDVSGFDVSKKMVEAAKSNFKKNSLQPSRISWGDIQDPMTYNQMLSEGKYDGLLAMGVMPHVHNDEFVLSNMRNMVRSGGKVFVEFRNKLFSLFTFNRYTKEFIIEDLLSNVSEELKEVVSNDLEKRLEMDMPKPRLKVKSNKKNVADIIGYDAMLSKLHNPFAVQDLFYKLDFSEVNLLWYHYHPAMPFLESKNRSLYRNEALKLEHESSGWKGLFLCSAFVVEATV